MKQVIRYQKASIFRRICSMAFDAIVFVSIGVLLLVVAIQPIIGSTKKYSQSYNKYIDLALATGLYEKDDSSTIAEISLGYDEKLTAYYNSNALEYTIADYNKLKSEQTTSYNNVTYNLFYADDSGTYVEYKAAEDQADLNQNLTTARTTFYKKLVKTLILEEINGRKITATDGTSKTVGNEELMTVARYVNSMTVLSWLIAVVLSVIITYLVFPMIFKDRATLGKKMFHFQVINSKTGFMATRLQTFARFVFFALFNVVGAVLTYGFSILISIIMAIMTKNRTTLHDLLASTAVVNTTVGSTSQNPQDYIAFEYDDGRPEPEEREVSSVFSVGEANSFEETVIEDESKGE